MFRSVISRSGNSSTIEVVRRSITVAFLAAAIAIFALGAINAHASTGDTKPQPVAISDQAGADVPECGPAWNVVSSPNQGAEHHRLFGVTAISANDVWAVGMYYLGGTWRTLTIHWNGSIWAIVPSPNVGVEENHLYATTAISANDVWAVGSYSAGAGLRPLIVHWDGISWTVVPSPHVGNDDLKSISAISATDIWAVGSSYVSNVGKTLILHWNGTAWSVVPGSNVAGAFTLLFGVTAVSANDVWAAGYYRYEALDQPDINIYQPLVLHWDGSTWSQVATPFVSPEFAVLNAVTTASPTELWLAGFYYAGDIQKTLIMRRSGTTWSVVPSPNVGSYDNQLLSIDFTSPNDGWAVGYYNNGIEKTLVLHWNGSSWSIVGGSNQGLSNNQLLSVAAFSAGDIWTVGNYQNASAIERTLIERHNPCVVILPTATPTATSTASVTPGPSATTTSIPSATSVSSATPSTPPTACPIQFTDVPQGSTFYTFVRCLACRNTLNGYPDGTFHPNDNITRGQISKIVSNAAGFSEPQTGRSFDDVAIGSTFHLYIERLATRGIIGGYTCGGAAEPCVGPTNRPYFRPSGNTTRGQLSKIVCRAYACSGTPTGQIFEDVPTNHTFYTEIAQLYGLGSISGYACGGPGEQCSTENKPYFRPAANVSRGQTAKIVSNTFFPGCQTP